MEFSNRNKYFAAQEEAKTTGGDVREIYLRMGGLIIEKEAKAEVKVEKPKKSKKK